jgi:hypothetical protein
LFHEVARPELLMWCVAQALSKWQLQELKLWQPEPQVWPLVRQLVHLLYEFAHPRLYL